MIKKLCMALLLILAFSAWGSELPFFSWAWELPELDDELYLANDQNDYAISKHYFWDPPEDFITGGFGYTNYRAKDNEDSDAIFYGIVARPMVFHLNETVTLSFGVYGMGQHEFVEGGRLTVPEEIHVNWENQIHTYGVGASFFLSMPFAGEEGKGSGIQIYLDLGHYWSKFLMEAGPLFTYEQIDAFLFTFDVNAMSNFRWIQEESGLNGYFQISYLADRQFLYGFHLAVSWSVPTGPKKVKLVQTDNVDIEPEIPILGIVDYTDRTEVPMSEVKTDFITTMLYIRAFSWMVSGKLDDDDEGIDEILEYQRITVEPIIGIAHYRMNQGHSLLWGARLNVLDIIGLSFIMDNEVNNNTEDRFIFTLEMGFRFGRQINNHNVFIQQNRGGASRIRPGLTP